MSGRHSTGERVASIEREGARRLVTGLWQPEFYKVNGHDHAPSYNHITKSLTHAHELAEMVELANKEERAYSHEQDD